MSENWTKWWSGEYPFDYFNCGHCLTAHHREFTRCTKHPELVEEVSNLVVWSESLSATVESKYDELLALRMKYDDQACIPIGSKVPS